jgi:hypothetical protein
VTRSSQVKYWCRLAGRGRVYYVTGPYFEDYVPEVDLKSIFEIGLANGDDHAHVRHVQPVPE